MTMEAHTKVTASHLKRDAYLYVRQSTVRQVFENQESTKRQYALRQRAVALGWPTERVVVIDSDLGQSAASAGDREGFQRLVAEVGMGRAGIVLGLEVSRLARNSSDWHRLLEICALSQTLILDEDGVYNPCDFNDRLLLGLKGTMSEAELHVLNARLRGGILNKARRGELQGPLPVGFLYDANGRVILDPDAQVQSSLRHFFATYRRTGTARATVKALRDEKVLMPRRIRTGASKGELVWGPIDHWRVLQLLHNPRYAGAFFFGRYRTRKLADGKSKVEAIPRDQWLTLLPGTHEGYISWEEHEAIQRQLLEHAQGHGADRRRSPPREGPSLLQGMVLCGKCGARMTVRYHQRHGSLSPNYLCQREGIERGTPICQDVPGAGVDEAIGELLIATMTPVALEVALTVQNELADRIDEADRLRAKQVERARYEADLARRRYMQVDPNNRLVADSLEAEWNERLRALTTAQEDYERQRLADRKGIDAERRAQVLALATDFPKLWRDPKTPMRERKRMLRLLVEDVTLLRADVINAHIRFRGGTTRSLTLPLPKCAWELRQTPATVLSEIGELAASHTDEEVAAMLNERGHRSGEGLAFHARMVLRLRREHGLKSRFDRLRDAGMLTRDEVARMLNVSGSTVTKWRERGLLHAERYNDKGSCLYAKPGDGAPTKQQGRKLSQRG
jgi:DNA invertase Pin-like site-specific DNA recombinase/DNA-binding transcriptional regulator YiaG